MTKLTGKTLNLLKSIVFRFDEQSENDKLKLIRELNECSLTAAEFKHYHLLLMTMSAYPGSKHLLDACAQALKLLSDKVAANKKLKEKLNASGILNTTIECNFSFEKVSYLVQRFPGQIRIHSASSDSNTQKAALKLLLPYVEYSKIHEGGHNLKQRLASFSGNIKQTDLEWLLDTIRQTIMDIKQQAFIYNQLGIFIQWTINDAGHAVSFLRGPQLPVYYHKEPLQRHAELSSIIKKKLPKPVRLNETQVRSIIDAARLSLTYLYRETEPFTNANPDDITLFQLDHGLSVALFGSLPHKRYSLEAYIGYMVFKNNIPASYGGGWLFGQRSQFGINILEPLRGGESSLIICELLRVYHQHFGATRFVVKPYQFGLHNPEAIQTGAFWFYYKLGFRPGNEALKQLALSEDHKRQTIKGYRSDATTLRKFTKSNIELVLDEAGYPDYDAEVLSRKITEYIKQHYNGNRALAIEQCYKLLQKNTGLKTHQLKQEDISYAKQMTVLFRCGNESDKWQKANSAKIIKLIQLKSDKHELTWINHLQKFRAFWKFIS